MAENYDFTLRFNGEIANIEQLQGQLTEALGGKAYDIKINGDTSQVMKSLNELARHIKSTGNTKIRWNFNTPEIDRMQRKVDKFNQSILSLSASSEKYNKNSIRDTLLTQEKGNIRGYKKANAQDNIYSQIARNASGVYSSDTLHGLTKKNISENEFTAYALAMQKAKDSMEQSYKEIKSIMSKSDWKTNESSVQRLNDLSSSFSANKAFFENPIPGSKSRATGLTKAFSELGINLDLSQFKDFGNISTQINQASSQYVKEATAAKNKIEQQLRNTQSSMMKNFLNEIGKGLELQDVLTNSFDAEAKGKIDQAIGQLKSKLESQKKTSVQTGAADEIIQYTASDDLSNVSLSDFKTAKQAITNFAEKNKKNVQMTAEEYNSLADAFKTYDAYRNNKIANGATMAPESSEFKQLRTVLKENSDRPITKTPSQATKITENTTTSDQTVSVKFKADTSQLDAALQDINTINAKDIVNVKINFVTNTASLDQALNDIRSLMSKDNMRVDIDFVAHTESIDQALNDIHTLMSKDRSAVDINFKANDTDLETAINKSNSILNDETKTIRFVADTSSIDAATQKLETLDNKDINVQLHLNAENAFNDMNTLEASVKELQQKLTMTAKLNTGQSFTTDKVDNIERIGTNLERAASKADIYGNRMSSALLDVGESVLILSQLIDELNSKFNLTGQISSGLAYMQKSFGIVNGTASQGTTATSDTVGNTRIDSLLNTIDNRRVLNTNLNNYLDSYKSQVNTIQQRVESIRTKYATNTIIDPKEIDEDVAQLKRLSSELSDLWRKQNSFKLQNNKGSIIGDNIFSDDFNENTIEKLFRQNVTGSQFLEAYMGKNGLTANVKAKSLTSGKIEEYALNLDAENGIVRSSLKSAKEYRGIIGQVFSELGGEVTKLSKYLISMGGIDMVWQGFRNGITAITDMDAAMTELRKVTDETDASYAKLQKNMFQTGKEIGADAVELTKSSADWARLGYSMEDSQEMSKWTNILMNVSEFENIDDATNSLISIIQGFDKSAQDMPNIVDVLNNIGNKFPISSDEIASSLQRSASALRAAGNTYEQSVALTTTANSVVQNPESVGAGLKTVSMRLRGTDIETLQAAGEDTDGVVESVSQLRQLVLDLTKVSANDFKGFDILTDSGEYKNTYEVLLGIGKIWDQIGAQQGGDLKQASLLEKLAGKQRSNIVASILQNPEMLESVYNETQNSEGSALKENEAHLDSIQGKVARLTASMQELWNNTIDSSFIKGLVDIGTQLTQLIDKFGLLKTAAAGIGIFAGAKGKLGRANYQLSSAMPRVIWW